MLFYYIEVLIARKADYKKGIILRSNTTKSMKKAGVEPAFLVSGITTYKKPIGLTAWPLTITS